MVAVAIGGAGLAREASAAETPRAARGGAVLAVIARAACGALRRAGAERLSRHANGASDFHLSAGAERACGEPAPAVVPASNQSGGAAGAADGTLIGRQRIAASAAVALDVVSYASDGLIVGGLLCYPADGRRHSTVVHVHGGLGGVFENAAGDLVQTCIDWAGLHGRVAFAPSLRGQDGGEGRAEMCLGEADDLVAAVTMLRGLDVVDAARVGLVGGSIGGCVVLRAAPRIPALSAVVAFVPPISWQDLVTYHRTTWTPATETLCDGTNRPWTIGGPAFADALDSVICGHGACDTADYVARSPLPYILTQTAPTLIVAAESDNVVPFGNQLLWSLMRQGTGHPVSVIPVDPCAPPGTPAGSYDQVIVAAHSFHLLSGGPISSAMLFLMQQLDAPAPPLIPGPAGSGAAVPRAGYRPAGIGASR